MRYFKNPWFIVGSILGGILFNLLFNYPAKAHSLKRNPIYHSIIILNKKLDRDKAFQYSNIISNLCRKHKIDPFLVVSIARQESRIKLDALGMKKEKKIKKVGNQYYLEIEVTDFCMMQIHKSNVDSMNLDYEKLITDPQYCIENGVGILASSQYLKDVDEYWWTLYNASEKKPHKREEYRQDVMKWYTILEDKIPRFQEIRNKYLKGN